MRRQVLVTSLLSMAWVMYLIGTAAAQVQDNRVSIEPDTDRFGADYAAFQASEEECRRRCTVDGRCKAFTFRRSSPWCWLKDQPQTPRTDSRFVSGMKGGWPDLSILSLNMAGHATLPDASVPGGADWKVRVDRLADSIASLGPGRRPDIISMTEVEGWRWCSPGTGVTVGDYDMIDRLIERLTDLNSVTYRIAYMVGNRGTFGAFSQCRYFSGDAVLYNPQRLVNRNPDDVRRFSLLGTQRYDSATQGFQLRRSLPLCRPGSARTAITRGLIDGAPQNDDCREFAPSGPAWTWILAMPFPVSTSTPPMASPISLARFSFRHDQRSSFDFFTVHPKAGHEDFSLATALIPFSNQVSVAPWRVDPAFYPPIMVGDLNAAHGNIESIPNFVGTHGADPDVMAVRRGNRSAFPALNDYRTLERKVLPEIPGNFVNDDVLPLNFFSDHIALFVRLGWVSPGDTKVSRTSDLPDGTVVGEENGGLWIIAGGAKFGIPDPATHDRLYQARWSLTLPADVLGAIGQVPVDGTLLRQENGALWVIVGGAKLRVPDQSTLSRLYPGARAVKLWDAAVASIPNAPDNGALMREEDGKIWVAVGGAKFHVPNPDVFNRLYPDGRPFPLWNGAPANIASVPIDGTLLREESSAVVFVMRDGLRERVRYSTLTTGDVIVLWDGALDHIPLRLPELRRGPTIIIP